MTLLSNRQAVTLCRTLPTVVTAYGFEGVNAFFKRLTGGEDTAKRLEVVLVCLSAGSDQTIALPIKDYPPVSSMTRFGIDSILHSTVKMVYYTVDAQRLIKALAGVMRTTVPAARCLLARPETLSYQDYMSSPQWKAKRLPIVLAAGGKCQRCGCKARLEVHHITYERLGCELPTDLTAVCPACHAKLDAAAGFGKGRNRRQVRKAVSYA